MPELNVGSLDPISAIEELREAGADGGDLMGYYCRGHVPRHEFKQAANERTGASSTYDARHVRADECRHEWWRTVPIGGEHGCSRFVSAEPGTRGAYKVTVWDGIERSRRYGMRDYIATDRTGHRRGFAEGVNWALKALSNHNRQAEEYLLAVWRSRGEADCADANGDAR